MIGLYECLKYYKNDYFTKKQCLLIGILCALTFLIRPNLVVVFAGFGIGIAIKLIIQKKFKELLKYIIYSLIGFAIVCIPIFIYLYLNGCIKDFIENVFIINMSINKCGLLASIKNIIMLIPVTFILIVSYIVVLIYKIIKDKKLNELGILCLAIITILFNSISLTTYFHYLIIFIPIFLLSLNNLLALSHSKEIMILSLLLIISIGIHNIIITIPNIKIEQPNAQIIEYIKDNTTENDKIAVIGFYDEIYYLSNRQSVSKYTYILKNYAFKKEIQTDIVTDYLNDIITKKPKIIVEDYMTLTLGVKPYIDTTKYDEFKDQNYINKSGYNNIKIYELNENTK